MRRSMPSIRTVTLRAGTKYRLMQGDGVSERRVLERDAEVAVRCLAFEPGEVAAYVLDDEVVLVEFEDERRGARTASP
jgi:hypothetical protein